MNFYGCFYYDVRKNSPKTVSQTRTPSKVVVESQTESPSKVVVKSQTEFLQNTNSISNRFVDLETQKELVEDIVDHSVDMIEDINDIKEKYQDYQKTHNNKDIVEIENDTRKIVQDGEVIYEDAKKLNWFNWLL